ncbi:HRDC domain-containing protein [Halpernia sp.]|uniref:HRDC domain-containing protein n=1 Tax=Halpernia sp. TaxID=2782209 RepID=UPI003A8D5063
MKVKILKVRLSEEHLIGDQKIVDNFLVNNEICKATSAFVKDENYWSVFIYYENLKENINSKYLNQTKSKSNVNFLNEEKTQKYDAIDEELNSDEIKILDSLKIWRSEKAKDQNLPAYFIATNKELFSIAKFKPIRKEELLEIKGFGKHKLENYGSEIIEILEQV